MNIDANKKYAGSGIRSSRVACLVVMIFVATMLWWNHAVAGTTLVEEPGPITAEVDVRLTGANEYGAVQLFAYLLTKVEPISAVVPVELHITSDEPQQCYGQWRLTGGKMEIGAIVEQLIKIINNLDPNGPNKVLYESPFIVRQGDVEQVKKIVPFLVSADRVIFVVAGYQDEEMIEQGVQPVVKFANPWLQVPGAGFD